MSKKTSRRRRTPLQIAWFGFAILLTVIFIGTLFLVPDSTTVTHNAGGDLEDIDFDPVSTVPPTQVQLPTPNPDGPQIELTDPIVQSNGLFQVELPDGWLPEQNTYQADFARARITSRNSTLFSVIDVMIDYGINYPSHAALSEDLFTDSYFFDAWGAYDGFTEISRTVDEQVVIDFSLVAVDIDYLGRQIAWLNNDWLHVVRAVVPENNPDLLDWIIEQVPPTLIAYEDTRSQPANITAFADPQQRILLRYSGWVFQSGSFGTPIVLENTRNDARIVARQIEETQLDSLEAAEAFVAEQLRDNIDIQSAQVTTRTYAQGYMVSYQDRDADGNPIAGLAVLLNVEDENALNVLEARVPANGIDLLSPTVGAEYGNIMPVADSFGVLPAEGFRQAPSENPATLAETFISNVERYILEQEAEADE